MSAPPFDGHVPEGPPSKRLCVRSKSSPFYVSLLEAAGRENGAANERTYLVTSSRVLPQPTRGAHPGADWSSVNGFAEFITTTKLEGPVVGQLLADIVAAGAVDVSELGPLDWPQLPSWQSLHPLEAQHILASIAAP